MRYLTDAQAAALLFSVPRGGTAEVLGVFVRRSPDGRRWAVANGPEELPLVAVDDLMWSAGWVPAGLNIHEEAPSLRPRRPDVRERLLKMIDAGAEPRRPLLVDLFLSEAPGGMGAMTDPDLRRCFVRWARFRAEDDLSIAEVVAQAFGLGQGEN